MRDPEGPEMHPVARQSSRKRSPEQGASQFFAPPISHQLPLARFLSHTPLFPQPVFLLLPPASLPPLLKHGARLELPGWTRINPIVAQENHSNLFGLVHVFVKSPQKCRSCLRAAFSLRCAVTWMWRHTKRDWERASVTARHGHTTFHDSRLSPILALSCAFEILKNKNTVQSIWGACFTNYVFNSSPDAVICSTHPRFQLVWSTDPTFQAIWTRKNPSFYMVGPHKRPTYGNRAKTHVRIVCKLTLLTMSDSTYGDDHPSRTRSLRVHPAFSQVLPQCALAREKIRMGAPMRMLDSTLS